MITIQLIRDALSVPSGEILKIRDPVQFESGVSLAELIETPVLEVNSGTTISVLNVTRVWLKNTGAVTVTNLTNGQEGQEVKFLGDGFTTIANNSTVKTSTGANKLLAVNKVYTFTRFNSVWVENA
jgi:hypothetical protein